MNFIENKIINIIQELALKVQKGVANRKDFFEINFSQEICGSKGQWNGNVYFDVKIRGSFFP